MSSSQYQNNTDFKSVKQLLAECTSKHLEQPDQLSRMCFESLLKEQQQRQQLEEKIDNETFDSFLDQLFVDSDQQSYHIPVKWRQEFFTFFDTNKDGLIDKQEFESGWQRLVQTCLKPKSALVVVDVQNDFICGSFSVAKSEEILPVINEMMSEVGFDLVVYSKDWHPKDHISFHDNLEQRKWIQKLVNGKVVGDQTDDEKVDVLVYDTVVFQGPPETEQTLWPRHCVQNTPGAELHPRLRSDGAGSEVLVIHKGTDLNVDSYSAFWDNNRGQCTGLGPELVKRDITDVYVCGVAYDWCVGLTAADAVMEGFRTTVVDDAARGIDEDGTKRMKNKLRMMDVAIVRSIRVKDMVKGRDRRPELAHAMLKGLEERKKDCGMKKIDNV